MQVFCSVVLGYVVGGVGVRCCFLCAFWGVLVGLMLKWEICLQMLLVSSDRWMTLIIERGCGDDWQGQCMPCLYGFWYVELTDARSRSRGAI